MSRRVLRPGQSASAQACGHKSQVLCAERRAWVCTDCNEVVPTKNNLSFDQKKTPRLQLSQKAEHFTAPDGQWLADYLDSIGE